MRDAEAVEAALAAGTLVEDPAGDAEFFLSEAEPGDPILEVGCWFEADVPIAAVFDTDWSAEARRLEGLNGPRSEAERFANVRAWVGRLRGWRNALAASPVVLLYRPADRVTELVDGWHRVRLAHGDGETSVRCLVGIL